MSNQTTSNKYHDFDWLRVMATQVVFVFYTAKPFRSDARHIRNAWSDPILEVAGRTFSAAIVTGLQY